MPNGMSSADALAAEYYQSSVNPFLLSDIDSGRVDTQPMGPMIENYIYLYHLDKFIVLPAFASDSIQDTMTVNFQSTSLLSRSAPIYSYANSGPRTMQMSFTLHRDMMMQINKNVSNVVLSVDNDYVDYIVNAVQTMALPRYDAVNKIVNPPLVAVRLGNDIFIKGVVTGAVGVTYGYPIIRDPKVQKPKPGQLDSSLGRYGSITLSFNIAEVDPYDADTVLNSGSFRGFDGILEAKFASLGANI